MKLRFGVLMAISLTIVAISLGAIGLVFAGFHAFRWVVYIGVPFGAVLTITCSVLAMAGKIEKG